MEEVMYNHSSFLIVAILFIALLVSIEFGFRLGGKFSEGATEATKSQINSIQASVLGVLALLLGFTFSLSLQRFDVRSAAVVTEANAIGTAMLRTDLLPEAMRDDSARLMRHYLDLRIDAGRVSLDREAEREALLLQSNAAFADIWRAAVAAAKQDMPAPHATSYLQSLNEMIDAYGSRDAALNRHVPEFVLFLLFITLLLAASLVGYGSGISKHRATFAAYTLLALIICLVFLIIDLDRPRRGLVEVSQQSLVDLQTSQAIE